MTIMEERRGEQRNSEKSTRNDVEPTKNEEE